MTGPRKVMSEEEKRKRNLKYQSEYQAAYGKKLWKCDICNIERRYSSRTKHLKSRKHLNNT